MPTYNLTRVLYNRCFRAWRKYATWEVKDVWISNVKIYRAAGDSFVASAGVFSGWGNHTRHLQFIHRKLDLYFPCDNPASTSDTMGGS